MRPPHLIVTLAVVVALSLSGVVAADSGTAIDHAGDELTLDAVDGEHVHGTTPFAPGTLIGVRVKSVGDTHPFLVSKAVRVGENGSFDVTFDLSEMAQLRGGPVQASAVCCVQEAGAGAALAPATDAIASGRLASTTTRALGVSLRATGWKKSYSARRSAAPPRPVASKTSAS